MEVTVRIRRELVIWSMIFAIAGIFQFYRGAPLDGVIFYLAIALMATTNTARFIPFGRASNRNLKWLYLIVVGLLTSFRVHTEPALISILLLVPIILLRKSDAQLNGVATLPMLRSVGVWAAFGVAVAFYEMLNFIVGDITDRPYHYPTISMLFDPMLHSPIGRAIFVICWGLIGYKIVFQRVNE